MQKKRKKVLIVLGIVITILFGVLIFLFGYFYRSSFNSQKDIETIRQDVQEQATESSDQPPVHVDEEGDFNQPYYHEDEVVDGEEPEEYIKNDMGEEDYNKLVNGTLYAPMDDTDTSYVDSKLDEYYNENK